MDLDTPANTPSARWQVRDGEAPAFYNAVEAAALVALAVGLLQQAGSGVAANDLGVIATYRKQARRPSLPKPTP